MNHSPFLKKRLLTLLLGAIGGFALVCCQGPERGTEMEGLEEIHLSQANGFRIFQGEGFKILEVVQAFPEKHRPFRYYVQEDASASVPDENFDGIVSLPVERIITTSTTHIPHLDLLEATDKLIGFPNPNLISSPTARQYIEAGEVRDLGKGAQSNVELMIEMEPDWVMISTLGDEIKNISILHAAGIPAILNGEYVEQNPLGRAEWIKFTGVLLGKLEEANRIFEQIEADYLAAEELAKSLPAEGRPTVLTGVMYKDVWYAPGRDSWGARLLESAGGNYLFEDQAGTGSAQLSYEYVLDRADEADFWIGAADFNSLQDIKAADKRYANLRPFQLKQVYTYTGRKGPTGGIEYFESGYMRPDLILQDLIKILHPGALPDYELYFYKRLNE